VTPFAFLDRLNDALDERPDMDLSTVCAKTYGELTRNFAD